MIVKILVENTSISDEFKGEHGLCLYIETLKHKILFDTGAGSLFAENAEKMGVDLSAVDLTVISHGHHDHGGGLATFLEMNTKAMIYITEKAFAGHYHKNPDGEMHYIGLAQNLQQNNRLVLTGENLIIDDELELFANVKGDLMNPSGNKDLWAEQANSFVPDGFSHEQNLIIKENEKTLLVCGCAHRGIVNIIEHLSALKQIAPTHTIGGFHLFSPSAGKFEDPAIVRQIGGYLLETGSKFYTGHCTGMQPYEILKEVLGEKIQYIPAGSQLVI